MCQYFFFLFEIEQRETISYKISKHTKITITIVVLTQKKGVKQCNRTQQQNHIKYLKSHKKTAFHISNKSMNAVRQHTKSITKRYKPATHQEP